jgi:hypothetical protein
VRVICGRGVEQPENPLKYAKKMKNIDKRPSCLTGKSAGTGLGNTSNASTISGTCARVEKYAAVAIFTPCAGQLRLLKIMNLTARNAAFGDVILISPACSSFDQFRNPSYGEEVFRHGTRGLADAISSVPAAEHPNTQTAGKSSPAVTDEIGKKDLVLHRGFLRQNPGAKTQTKPTSQERTPTSANHS